MDGGRKIIAIIASLQALLRRPRGNWESGAQPQSHSRRDASAAPKSLSAALLELPIQSSNRYISGSPQTILQWLRV
jgi:hypothetical protein